MHKAGVLATLLLSYVVGISSWQQCVKLQPWNHRAQTRRRSQVDFVFRMLCGDVINVEAMWPALAGKKTCANSAAGRVIREAWAHEECSHHKANQEKQERDWTISRQMVEYKDGEMALQGLYARPQGKGLRKKLPGVILAHTAVGPQEDFILWKLDSLAVAGYAAFALDMFGTGRALWDRSESLAARRVITEDRSLMQSRASAALRTLAGLPGVDPDNIAAVGYCFGGMVVLDLARMGAPPGLRAVASLHGILVPTHTGAGRDLSLEQTAIAPRVLVLHASKDPFVPPEQVRAMEEEFARRRAKLEVVKYGGNARHAFTRPEKIAPADREAGLSYDEEADADSWRRVLDMLRQELKQ